MGKDKNILVGYRMTAEEDQKMRQVLAIDQNAPVKRTEFIKYALQHLYQLKLRA